MHIDFSKLFHRASKDLADGGAVHIPKDTRDWPEAWNTIVYKTYGKLPQISLPPNTASGQGVFSLIGARKSQRNFSGGPVSVAELSTILKYSCGEMERTENGPYHRAQPSGGARYPIEAYVLVFRSSSDLSAGVYHYNVQKHALDVVWKRTFEVEDISKLFSYEWTQTASAAIILTADFHRTKRKYGQRGYRYIMLEAGHIGQNVYLTSQALGVGCSAMGGSLDGAIEQLLGIDGENESLVYSLIVGK